MPEKIQFFPLDATYKVQDGKAVINLYGRASDGRQLTILDYNFEPYFYVIPKDSANISEKLEKIKWKMKMKFLLSQKQKRWQKNFSVKRFLQ